MSIVASPTDVRHVRTAERLEAQTWLWKHTTLRKSVAGCGRRMADGVSAVQLRVTSTPEGRRAGFAGLQTCGSVWVCPCCSAKILARRQDEVRTAASSWMTEGGQVAFLTFTVRHNSGQSASEVWDAVTAGWHAVTSGRDWQATKVRFGVEHGRKPCPAQSCGQDTPRGKKHAASGSCSNGWVIHSILPWLRVVEVTHGDNGWHVHVHALVFLPHWARLSDLAHLYTGMWKRWNRGAADAGCDGSQRVNVAKFVLEPDALSTYVTKTTFVGADKIGLEVARGDLKDGRRGSRTPFGILRDLVAGSDDRDLALWHEFEVASRGRRQMTWAVGARPLVGLHQAEEADEAIAAEELGSREDNVADLDGHAWRQIAYVPGRRAALLRAAEHSTAAAWALLAEWGIPVVTYARVLAPPPPVA